MKRKPPLIAAGLAAAMITLGLVASPAAAAPVVDPSQTVTLNIHKHLGTLAATLPNDGTAQTVNLPTLQGVDFDVYQVYTNAGKTTAVDLTTNAGWQVASAIAGVTPTPAQVAAGSFVVGGTTYYLGTATTVTTNAGGLATFTKAAGVGLYLVNENLASSATITKRDGGDSETIPASQISPSAAFFVTLPMTNPVTRADWTYTVDVYPKNQMDTVTKTVADKGSQSGEATGAGANHTVVYTITSSVTDGLDASAMGSYVITDILDSRLTLDTVAVTVGGTTLRSGTDYTTSGNVVITLTQAGRTALVTANAANPAVTVITTITAEITGTEGANGAISNQAYVIPNKAWAEANSGKDGMPTGSVTSKYGDLIITKQDPQDAAASMTGAVFAVFLDPTPALGNATNTCSATDVNGSPVATGSVSGNTVTIKGLETSDFYNGATQTDLIHYCLVETRAPAGYNLNAEPIPFTINENGGSLATTSKTVYNAKSNLGNSLPFTGGAGIFTLSVAGLVLVGGGIGLYILVNRRRARQEA